MINLRKNMTRFVSAATTIAVSALLALPLQVQAATTAEIRATLADFESRMVAPPFLASVQSNDASSIESGIYQIETLLDFPSTGYQALQSDGSISVSELVSRTLTNRATLIERACAIVDTAGPNGRPSLSSIATRVAAIQTALQRISATVSATGRVSLGMAADALAEVEDMMATLGSEGDYVASLSTGSISVSALNTAVQDIYNRASLVCGTYGN